MKVILLKDEKSLGKKDSVINVADSYARNVLLPKKIVLEATEKNINELKQKKEKEERERQTNLESAKKLKEKLNKINELVFIVPCSTNGKMFGSITNRDVSDRLNSLDVKVDKKDISMPVIKSFKEVTCDIHLFEDIRASLKITVIGKVNDEN